MGFWEDAKYIALQDPAATGPWQVFFMYPGYHAVRWHRLAHWLHTHGFRFVARGVSQLSRFLTGIEIHPGATIGKCLFIDHGMGIVIGETAEIGDYCNIYHGVTLGGTGKHRGKRHPTLGNHVLVGAGAKILGPFTVGDNARIGGNAVVLKEVPPNATVVGVPGNIIASANNQQEYRSWELDQVSLPDPIQQEIDQLQSKLDSLSEELLHICRCQGACPVLPKPKTEQKPAEK
ncbi:MAG: serine O-acetyltransferase [Firmicutes bacterium]|nr:serine O-acetyltransferase [Bacillota bacterium]